ncbi:MAG: hypothetical protein UW95_C0005G0032 [Parcubacteria group bacterium GW2011_GWC1_45_14]|nr:MAG: hypothetical protein UW95_C0005G0032 [Parcubacteria group bacterium GW2011_GWC1_45_14]
MEQPKNVPVVGGIEDGNAALKIEPGFDTEDRKEVVEGIERDRSSNPELAALKAELADLTKKQAYMSPTEWEAGEYDSPMGRYLRLKEKIEALEGVVKPLSEDEERFLSDYGFERDREERNFSPSEERRKRYTELIAQKEAYKKTLH